MTGPKNGKRVLSQRIAPPEGMRLGRPRNTISSRIYADLRTELLSLQRRPGAPLSEAEIALRYGVSRTPVREAMLKLADEGLVEIFPQSGIIASRIRISALPEAIVIRKALEETTARCAAECATASQVLSLRSILERQRETDAAGDRDAFHEADEAFHSTIADIAHYPGIWRLIVQVKVHVDRFRRLTLPQTGRMQRVITEHETILDAIEAHDPADAGRAMARHLEGLQADIRATQSHNPEFFDERG